MSFADLSDIKFELSSQSDEFSDDELEKFLRKGHHIVSKRLPHERDEQLLADLEALAGAHLAYGRISGAMDGEVVESIEQQSASITFNTDHVGPGDYSSPYWNEAVQIDSRMQSEKGFWSVTL